MEKELQTAWWAAIRMALPTLPPEQVESLLKKLQEFVLGPGPDEGLSAWDRLLANEELVD